MASMGAGTTVDGPAIVEQADGVIVVPPGASARIDDHRNLILTAKELA
jgi:N-methylhydantoinase A/oxoprolinase/acetone carboxylase beta subunit